MRGLLLGVISIAGGKDGEPAREGHIPRLHLTAPGWLVRRMRDPQREIRTTRLAIRNETRRVRRELCGKKLATRLGLPLNESLFYIVDSADKAFKRLDDADEAWRFLEALAIRHAWWERKSPRDDRRGDDAEARLEAQWFWRIASTIDCEHAPKGLACEACLSAGRNSFEHENHNAAFPPARSSFVAEALRAALVPYLEDAQRDKQ